MIDGTENFTPEYREAMLKAERAKCEKCGKSIGAHAATFVREACNRAASERADSGANPDDRSRRLGATHSQSDD